MDASLSAMTASFMLQVECGLDHTLVLTTDGEVYSCGLGADGQTGLGHYESVGQLTRVRGDIEAVRIAQLSCRSDCVLAVSGTLSAHVS